VYSAIHVETAMIPACSGALAPPPTPDRKGVGYRLTRDRGEGKAA